MPPTMTHLMVAQKYNPNASTLFNIGTVAPDVTDIREIKDKTHFRDIPILTDRMNALINFAKNLDKNDDFIKGILLHLYSDYYWDIGPMQIFTKQYTGNNWFTDYRKEIKTVGSWLFHNKAWAPRIWEEMSKFEIPFETQICEVTKENLTDFLTRNRSWHSKTVFPESKIFTSEILENYSSQVAESFEGWLEKI